jgi:hypothetical protein
MDQFVETEDGVGILRESSTVHGRTSVRVESNDGSVRGWYELQKVSLLEDHSTEYLSQLPASGVTLPWDPAPRYTDFDTTTIQPTADLQPDLKSTNSLKGIRNYTDPMEIFPSDPRGALGRSSAASSAAEEPREGVFGPSVYHNHPTALIHNNSPKDYDPTAETFADITLPRSFSRSYYADISEVHDQQWDDLPDDSTVDEPFQRQEDHFKPEKTKEAFFDFLGPLTSETRTANKYIEKRGHEWVILHKGTGDVLSRHSSQEKAEAAFRAMEMHKHEGGIKETPEGWYVTTQGGSSGPYPTRAAAEMAEQQEESSDGEADGESDNSGGGEEKEAALRDGASSYSDDVKNDFHQWAQDNGHDPHARDETTLNHYMNSDAPYQVLDSDELRSHLGHVDIFSIEAGTFLGANENYIEMGDRVEVTRHSDARDLYGRKGLQLNPGDTGVVLTVPNNQWAEVKLASGGEYEIDLDDLKKIGFSSLALDTHDESQDNPSGAGAFAQSTPDVPDDGVETEAGQTKDNPTSFTAATNLPPFVRPDFEVEGEEAPHDPDYDPTRIVPSDGIPNDDRLRNFTSVEDSASSGSLDYLLHEDSSARQSSFDGFDPATVNKIYKNSAKNYTMTEQSQLIDEEGFSDRVSDLRLENSFYEIS